MNLATRLPPMGVLRQGWVRPLGTWVRPLGTLAFVILLATIFSPRAEGIPIFWRTDNLANVLRQISDVGILALGMTLVIIAGGIDLSVGSLLALSCTIFAYTFTEVDAAWSPFLGVALAILAATTFGLISGMTITRLRLQPFIVTLAVMISSRGFAKWLVSNATIAVGYDDRTRPWVDVVGHKAFVISTFAVLAALCAVLLNWTRFGRYVFAVGGNEDAARLSGINVGWVKVRVYALSGFIAGIAGILYCSETHLGNPNAGQAYELDAIAAAVIGGTSLMGGRGSITGTIVGALVLGIISNVLGLNNVQENVQWMIKGGIILAAVWLQMVGRKTA